MKKLYETRSVVHQIDSDNPTIKQIIFRDFSLYQVYLSYRDEMEFLLIEDVHHKLINAYNQPANPQGIWHKKELVRNLLAYGYFDPDNSVFHDKFEHAVWNFRGETFTKESLETHYQFLLSLPIMEKWMKTREFRQLASEETKQTYRRSLRIFFQYLAAENLDINDFTVDDIEDFFNQLKRDKTNTYYVNKLYYAMLHFVRYAKPELEHDFVSFVRVSSPPSLMEIAPKSVPKDIINKLYKYLNDTINLAETKSKLFDGIRNKCIVDIMFETGVRLSEVVNLDMDSVSDGALLIRGKGNKERVIPLNSVVRRSLEDYLAKREEFVAYQQIEEPKTSRPLFYSNQKRRMSGRSIARIFEKVEGLHPHLSRHTLITDMVRSKEDMPLIMGISAHSSMNMIARYAKPSQADLLRALERKANRSQEEE